MRWLARRGCISSGALYLARSTRTGIASPHHTFPPEPGLQSLLEWQIPTVVLWEGGQKLYSQSLNVATQRGVMPLPILGIPKFFTELALARVEVEAACSQEDQQLGVV